MLQRTADAPIYIPSRGRADSRLTVRALEAMHVPYRVIVEAQEFAKYAAVIDKRNIMVLDPHYQRTFETCDSFGDTKLLGPSPARNMAWDDAIARGFSWYWTMDDNIRGFWRLNRNLKVPVADGTCFRAMQDFCERYTNVLMAGPNYEFLAKHRQKLPPFVANTRIYSCNLVRCDAPYRWRSRYNDDTDLSLRMLKDGWCTVLFNAFLQGKQATMTVKGGNVEIYTKNTDGYDGRLEMAKVLKALHPDVTQISRKFGRWQHHVDYRPFRANKLIRRPDVAISDEPNEYGMELVSAHDHSAPAPLPARRAKQKRVAK
jgi:hypothetical protein